MCDAELVVVGSLLVCGVGLLAAIRPGAHLRKGDGEVRPKREEGDVEV